MNPTYRYGKQLGRNIQPGTEVRMADGKWATITRVEVLRFEVRWRMERDDRFLATVDVYASIRYRTRRPKES